MTHKKQAILDSAQYLIASQGYDATSTRSIAKRAKVSEGLIFRHFENKEGLMQSLLKRGEVTKWKAVEALPQSERGKGGFGSTGKK